VTAVLARRSTCRASDWVRPAVVVEVTDLTWTEDDLLRRASYQGQREDKPGKQVVRPIQHPASASHLDWKGCCGSFLGYCSFLGKGLLPGPRSLTSVNLAHSLRNPFSKG
jgi:hypothetical protein